MAAGPSGTLAFLFTDVQDSTRLWESHPEAMRTALACHDEVVRAAIESHGGHVVKTLGDGFHAVFVTGYDAVRAAVAIQLGLAEQDWPEGAVISVRAGIHAGEASERDGDYFGTTVNTAARLMAAAHGGQIVCSGLVAELVGDRVELVDLGVHRLRNLESAVHVWQVSAPGLARAFPPLRSLEGHRSNLPQELSEFVGRDRDVRAVMAAIAKARVVSLVGVGGVGKTRLALRAASELLPEFSDGVWLCELASVRDPAAVAEAVAGAMSFVPSQGVSLHDGLIGFFRDKQLLLVLDNCEQVLRGVADLVTALAKGAPRLSILATSREALGVSGERAYPVGSLEIPTSTDPECVGRSEAGALFTIRAGQANPAFELTAGNATEVSELCARLDGIPLAIELAAARARLMSPSELLAHLGERFRLLTGGARGAAGRHETLRAAMDWSYALLDTAEAALLDRLSAFVGDFGLDAAITVAADVGLDRFEALDALGSLVAKSLVETDQSRGVTRYRLLETIRQFAAEKLETSVQTATARDRHARLFCELGSEQFALLDTAQDFEALEQLRIETPNLAAALRWLLECGRFEDLADWFLGAGWVDSGLLPFVSLDELGRVAAEALDQPGVADLPGTTYLIYYAGARAFFIGDHPGLQRVIGFAGDRGDLSPAVLQIQACEVVLGGDFAGASTIAELAVERARRTDDVRMLAFMLALRSVVEWPNDRACAVEFAEDAVAVARQSAARSALIYPLLSLTLAAQADDPERALAAAEECIRIDRGDRRAWSTVCEGFAAMIRVERGERAAGLRLWNEVLHRFDWAGEHVQFSLQLPNLAEMLADTEPELAIQLGMISESDAIAPFPVFSATGWERLKAQAKALGPDVLDAARSRAAAMSYRDATNFVYDAIQRLIAEGDEDPSASGRALDHLEGE